MKIPLTALVLCPCISLHQARVYNENKVCECFVAIRCFILPTLLKEIIKVVPLLELEDCFQLELHDLKVF